MNEFEPNVFAAGIVLGFLFATIILPVVVVGIMEIFKDLFK